MLERWHGLKITLARPQPNEASIANAGFPDSAELRNDKMSSIILLRYVYPLRLQEFVYFLFRVESLVTHEFFSPRVKKDLSGN